jgi:hypothetical protein
VLPGVPRFFQRSRSLNRGKGGQLRITEALDELRSFGYRVFHDLTHDGYHLDHVIVGPTGVFAIETKFRSGDAEIASQDCEYPSQAAGQDSLAEGSVGENDSLKSASDNPVEVNRAINENCEFDGWVWPLVIIAGEWRVKNDLQTAGARLFTIDKLANHVVNQQSRLTSTEIKLIASHLER